MSSNFNLFYHGSASDISDALEAGANLDQYEAKALLCNIIRRIDRLEKQAEARIYRVKVRKIVAFGMVHTLDEDVEGEYQFAAGNEEDALDKFHLTVPIKVLEDFEITAELVK